MAVTRVVATVGVKAGVAEEAVGMEEMMEEDRAMVVMLAVQEDGEAKVWEAREKAFWEVRAGMVG